jgi:VWFA-related protein
MSEAIVWSAASDTVFRANANLVELNLVVTDESGNYVSGIQAGDLRVLEDGQPQKIRSFLDAWAADPGDQHAAVGIYVLFDTSDSMYGSFPGTEDSIAAFIRSLRPSDLVAINTFSANLRRLSLLSADHQSALANLRQAISGGDTALYNAVLLSVRDAAKVPGRKTIVVFSNGPDTASMVSPEDVGRVAEREGVPIYLFSRGKESPRTHEDMKALAHQTGGRVFRARTEDEQARAFTAVRDDLAHSYVLTYTPGPNENRGFRKIDVEVSGHGKCQVRARAGYTLQ